MKLFGNKKGQIRVPGIVNILLGLVLIAAGGIGIFGEKVGITLPELPAIIFAILISAGGFIMLLDAFIGAGDMTQTMPKSINMGLGFIILISGGVLLLQHLEIIPVFEVPQIILHAIMIAGGFILLLDGFLGANNMSM